MEAEVMHQEAASQEAQQDFSSMDDAELEKALNTANKPTDEGTPPEEKEGAPKEDDKAQPPKEGKSAEVEKPELTEEEKAAKQEADRKVFLQRQEEEKARLNAEINANANQIGELRKIAAQRRQQAKDAEEATETLVAIDRVTEARELERRALDMEAASRLSVNRQTVSTLSPEFETLMPEIEGIVGEHLSALGRSDEERATFISAFRKSPYETSASTLVALAAAASARKESAALKAEIEKLKGENATLAKKSDEILKQVARAADSPSVLAGKSAGTSREDILAGDLSSSQIQELSDEELNAFLEKRKKT